MPICFPQHFVLKHLPSLFFLQTPSLYFLHRVTQSLSSVTLEQQFGVAATLSLNLYSVCIRFESRLGATNYPALFSWFYLFSWTKYRDSISIYNKAASLQGLTYSDRVSISLTLYKQPLQLKQRRDNRRINQDTVPTSIISFFVHLFICFFVSLSLTSSFIIFVRCLIELKI